MIRIGCELRPEPGFFFPVCWPVRGTLSQSPVHLLLEITVELIRQLHTGKLDMVIGVNQQAQPQLERIPLLEETLFLFASPSWWNRLCREKVGQRLTLEEISRLPLCRNLPESTLTQMLERQAAKENVLLEPACTCSDYTYQIDLCQAGLCGCFLPNAAAAVAGRSGGRLASCGDGRKNCISI